MPGRGPGLSGWSAYTALRRLSPDDLVARIVAALVDDARTEDEADRLAARRVGSFAAMVEAEARRRIAEEKGADHVADVAIRPSIDRLDFTAAKRADLEEMRREIYPLARRLATRLAREQHARRSGPLDFRRTVRASISTGGVPLTTHHRPKRPHRRGARGRRADRGRGGPARRPPGRHLRGDGRGRGPPPDRGGEGGRPRRRRRRPAQHRPPRLHRRQARRPRGDAPRDLLAPNHCGRESRLVLAGNVRAGSRVYARGDLVLPAANRERCPEAIGGESCLCLVVQPAAGAAAPALQ
jgi:hypothetical protein